ncbi:ROK family transcriptional regulator [Terrarubrum flagellatum]|uniref:ROK family transcriptional regulator n=1 Tax=Terrirubrum flagellatum TaxID=2895980 RepID=UPI0031451E38
MRGKGRGANSVRVRMFNERVLLTQLRRLGQASQKELADASGLTVQAVVDIVDGLLQSQLVRPVGKRAGRVGQPSMLYAIDPDGVFACGLRVGAASAELVLVDFEGNIRARQARAMPPHFNEVSAFASEGYRAFLKDGPVTLERTLGLGVALSHALWYGQGRAHLPPEVAASWADIDLAKELKAASGLAVFVENETRVAAIAEYLLGEAQDFENFLYVSIGAHISGALVMGGNLLGGAHGNTSTLGAIPVGPSRLAHADSRAGGRLDDRASLDGLIRHLGLHGFTIRAVSELPNVLDQARGVIQEWVDDCIEALVEGLTACFAVVPVETVIIDSALPQFLVLEIVDRLERRLSGETKSDAPRLRMSRLGQDAALVGSAILPVNAHFFPSSDVLVGDSALQDFTPRRRDFFRNAGLRKNQGGR